MKKWAYYNEFNPESAAMIREMMKDKLITDGEVDERSIELVSADDVRGFKRVHWFAGICGWEIALNIAKFGPDRDVWTGSCPCQPFSSAGRQKGKDDDRHLWPVWQRLISECRPSKILGEQVASAIAHGWLDDVYQGLEPEGYAVASAVLPAASVGAPHKRDRLWFVANSTSIRIEQVDKNSRRSSERDGTTGGTVFIDDSHGTMDNSILTRLEGYAGDDGPAQGREEQERSASETGGRSALANSNSQQQGQERGYVEEMLGLQKKERQPEHSTALSRRSSDSSWSTGVWIDCPDGKKRLVEPSIRLLADGVQHRRPILHAFGNAIVPQLASEFIKASW